MTADQIRSLQPALAALLLRFRGCFQTQRTFGHWEKYLLGLLADLQRKSIEPIALAAGVSVRTLQEFLAFFVWDDQRVNQQLQQMVADEHDCETSIGVLDASGHVKQGDKTPGVQRQWCGEVGKKESCVVGQHLLYTNNDPKNPFTCMLASDLYLPQSWSDDRARCRAAKIPDDVVYRPKWRMGIDQIESAIGNGVRFAWMTFDEDYGIGSGSAPSEKCPRTFTAGRRGRAIALSRRLMRPSGWTTCAGSAPCSEIRNGSGCISRTPRAGR
jgi:SRSO17 transposase